MLFLSREKEGDGAGGPEEGGEVPLAGGSRGYARAVQLYSWLFAFVRSFQKWGDCPAGLWRPGR